MRSLFWVSIVGLALTACSGSTGDKDEETPELTLAEADPDGDIDEDGLTNAEEMELGLDPEEIDSDGDFCADGREVDAGSDPLDAASTLYSEGGLWPCSIEGQTLDPSPAKAKNGKVFKDFGGHDQHGDSFSLWDFHKKEGVDYIVVDVSAEWCPPCNDLAAWLDHDLEIGYWDNVRNAVDDGNVVWVTYLDQDVYGEKATKAVVKRWFEEYPHPDVPVVTDKKQELLSYMEGGGWPTVVVLNSEMEVVKKVDNYGVVLDWLDGELQ